MNNVIDLNDKRKNKAVKQGLNSTFTALKWVRELDRPHMQKVVLYALVARLNPKEDSYQVFPGADTLCRDAGIAQRKTLFKHLADLEKAGLIKRERRGGDGRGARVNMYTLLVTKSGEQCTVSGDIAKGGAMTPVGESNDPSQESNDPSQGSLSLKSEVTIEVLTTEESTKTFRDKPENKKNELEKTPEGSYPEEKEKPAPLTNSAPFPVLDKFWPNLAQQNPHSKIVVGFWWQLIREYHPDLYKLNGKLTKKQLRSLYYVFDDFEDAARCRVLAQIEFAVAHWEAVVGRVLKSGVDCGTPPKNPTSTWIVANADIIEEAYQEAFPAMAAG